MIYQASGTIRRARFVKVSGNNTVAEAGANERCIGVAGVGSREAPIPSVTADPPEAAQSGDAVRVHLQNNLDEALRVEAGGTITAGDLLESGSGGVAVTATGSGTHLIEAIALEGGVAGELLKIFRTQFEHIIA